MNISKADRRWSAVVSLGMSEEMFEDIDDVDDTEEQECVHMDMVKRKKVFDNFDNNVDGWIEVAKQQMLFFSDIQQHIINLKIEKETLDNEIECILSFIETTTYNVAQGYKVYKILRDKSSHRKKLKKEIDQLEALVGNFDCSEMRRLYQSAVGKMQHALSTGKTEMLSRSINTKSGGETQTPCRLCSVMRHIRMRICL